MCVDQLPAKVGGAAAGQLFSQAGRVARDGHADESDGAHDDRPIPTHRRHAQNRQHRRPRTQKGYPFFGQVL